jgi:transposase
MTYSVDFRRKVLSIREKESLTMQEVASRFDVGVASVMRWAKRVAPKANRHKPATKIDMGALAKDVEKTPDSYQYERAERFSVSPTCIRKALIRLGVTYKKKPSASKSIARGTYALSAKTPGSSH